LPLVGKRLRRLGMGLATLVGSRPRGYFIPYRYAGTAAADYPALEPLFVAAGPGQQALLATIAAHATRLHAFAGPPPAPRWDQDWFPRLDGAAAYALVRSLRPRRIVEIGCGHSTRFLAAALADGALDCGITCIDPAPRARLAGLPVRHLQRLLQQTDPGELAALGPGDFLFVDSSHVAMPGSDVDRLLGDTLPRLAAGVVVHLHDVFLPDAYPAGWAWRGYNEQLAVACLLQGGAFEILLASHWVATRHAAWLAAAGIATLPLLAGAFETSLWLRKRA
jgi:predicted O-methyltransferase YrrM